MWLLCKLRLSFQEWSLWQQVMVIIPNICVCKKQIGIVHAPETQTQTQTLGVNQPLLLKVFLFINQTGMYMKYIPGFFQGKCSFCDLSVNRSVTELSSLEQCLHSTSC